MSLHALSNEQLLDEAMVRLWVALGRTPDSELTRILRDLEHFARTEIAR